MHISKFIRQKSYEHVVYILRRHPFTFIPTLLLFLVLWIIPIVLFLIARHMYPDSVIDSQIYPLIVLGGSLYYLSTYLFFYAQFIDYYLDIWIVTNDRIVDVEQHGLFHKITTELDLYRIQDITTQTRGVWGTFFKYGDVTITTASTTSSIVFRQVPHPDKVREDLIQLADEDRKYHQGSIINPT